MVNEPSQLTLNVDPGPGSDEEERATLARRLREELEDLAGAEVREVVLDRDAGGGRAKGADIAWGTLAVTVAPALITALVSTLQPG